MGLPLRTASVLPHLPSEWNLASLSGRLTELSGAEDSAALTLAFGLLVVRQARRRSSLEWEDEDPSDDELPESNA